MSTIRKIALVILAAALAGGLGLLYWSSRTDTGYVARGPIARYQQITDADLAPVSVPAGRPADFPVVTDKAQLVGLYAAEAIAPGALFAPSMVVAEPPRLRTFNTGKELPEGMRGYPLTLASDLAPVLRDSDLVDLVMVNPGDGTATWLLSNIEPLAIVAPEQGRSATYILALTPEQAAIVDGALADATAQQTSAYARLLLSQSANSPIPPGTKIPYRDQVGISNPGGANLGAGQP
jgi:hypothetical protein